MQPQRFLTDILKRDGSNFDILRLVAALGVIVGHAYAIAPQPPLQDAVLSLLHFDYSGSLAVKFFFFLSGLLVTNSIISKPDAFQFLLKRAFRIFPGLLICLVVSVFIIGPIFTKLSLAAYFSYPDTWKYLLHNFVLTEMIWSLPGVFAESKFGLNGSLWTLPYEVLCYLYLSILYGLGMLKNKIVANIFFALVLGVSFISPDYLPAFFSQNPEAHLLPGCFAIGCLFANNKNNVVISVSHLILVWLLFFLFKHSAGYQFLFYIALFYSSIFISSRAFVRNYLNLPFDASYGVYIYGFVIQQCIFHLFPDIGLHQHQILAAVIAMAAGILSWYLIEKRFISLGNTLVYKINNSDLKNKSGKWLKNSLSFFKTDKINAPRNFTKFCILLLAAGITHALVLKFIYPGYYSPLYPQHSDFYIPVMFANSPSDTFLSLLAWPRPVNMIFAKFIGYFGIKGSIAWVIAIVFVNCSFSALLLIRLFKLQFNLRLVIVFCLYCYLLFSEPFFYIFYAQDLGAQLAYFFLISGAYILYIFFNKPAVIGNLIFFIFCLLAFLSKETYGLAALLFGLLWFIYYRKQSFLKAFLPGVSIAAALLVAMLISIFIKSVFVDLNAAKDSPYQISFNPWTILKEWSRYALEGVNIINLVMLLVLVYLLLKERNTGTRALNFVIVGCIAGAALSWLPNALLPNHHYKGYSFNGAYLLYLPCLFLAALWTDKSIDNKVLTVMAVLCLFSPLLSISKYKHNRWVLIQEETQRNLLHALKPLMKGLLPSKEPQKVLIEGITFPFHPFAFPQSLRVFPNAKYANFDIVNYDSTKVLNARTDLVRFVNMKDIKLTDYQQQWIFDGEGKLLSARKGMEEKFFAIADSSKCTTEINLENFSKFATAGFYNEENGIRWTNGNAAIAMKAVIEHGDSLIVKLYTSLPPVSKDIKPKLFFRSTMNKQYQPVVSAKKDAVFYYLFVPEEKETIQTINIISETIDASPDQRILSFPFKSLEIKILQRQTRP
ncbi:MAG: acyltransferase, partial [Ferruginibacter sp.]